MYPLSRNSIEDQLTPESISSGLSLAVPGLRDEFGLFPFAQFAQQRLLLLKRINEAATQPQVRRTPRPLPALSVATKEQKEEFLSSLASVDAPLSSLLSTAPHGLKGSVLLDEMWTRGVSVARAVWFIRVVYRNSVSDSARVRVSSQQRCRLWTDEVRRYLEQLLNDVSTAAGRTAKHTLQSAGPPPFAQLMDKFSYMVVLVAVTYNEGLMARIRWLDWLVDLFLALATALLSLPSSYPPSTASSTLQAFASSFILWQHKASLLFLLLSPFQSALQLSSFHSFRLFHCLSLIRHKLRGMVGKNDETRVSKERALHRCESTIAVLTDAVVGGDMWESWVNGASQPLAAPDDTLEGATSAAQLLVNLENFVGKEGEGRRDILRCLHAAAVSPNPLSVQPMHVMLEWCTHPHFIHHKDSVATVFTLVCSLAAHDAAASSSSAFPLSVHDTNTAISAHDSISARSYAAFISPVVVSSSPIRAHIAASLHSFLLLFPTLPTFISAVCRQRLLCLLAHFVSVGLFDYPKYVHYLLRMDLLSSPSTPASPISSFSVESLCYLPAPTFPSESCTELRRVALYGTSSVKHEEAALYWHSMCVLLQRAPAMSGEVAQDVWKDRRRQCASKLQRLHVPLIRGLRGLHPYIVGAIDDDTAMLAPASLGAFLTLLPFQVSHKLLCALVDDLLAFVQSSLSTAALWPAALDVYVDRVVRFLLFLLETSPHFTLLFWTLFRLLSLSSAHRFRVDGRLFSVLRRHWSLLSCCNQSPVLHSALVLYLRRFDDAPSAERCLELCGLPAHFIHGVKVELASYWQVNTNPAAAPAAILSHTVARPTLPAENIAALLESYRTRQADLSTTVAAIRELGPATASTLQTFQREVIRHVLLLALTSPTAVGTELSLSAYAALPHMQPSNVKLRLADFCCMLQAMAESHTEMGRERTDAATSLLSTVLLAARACDELDAGAGEEEQASSKHVNTWKLQELVAGQATRSRNAAISEKSANCLSLFLLMAVNRDCLRLGRCLAHFSTELFIQPGGSCLRQMTSLLFSSSGARISVWECDRRWMDDNIQADGEAVFQCLCVGMSATAVASNPTADALLQCMLTCRAVQQLCAHHLPSFYHQLQAIHVQRRRVALFNYIDAAVASIEREQEFAAAQSNECGGMEGVSEAMVQELVRQDKSRRLLSETQAALPREPLVLSDPVEASSLLTLLSSLSLATLPFLHIRLQLHLDASGPSMDVSKQLVIATLLQAAQVSSATQPSSPSPSPNPDDAYALLRLLCSTDEFVCQQLAESLASQLAEAVNDLTSSLSSTQPALRHDNIQELLLFLTDFEQFVGQHTPPLFLLRAASLLSSLYCSSSLTVEQTTAFVQSLVRQLSSIAEACNAHSSTLLSTLAATWCLETLDTLRFLLLPLLPHLSKAVNSAVLDELLKSCLSLLVFPLASLSASPDDRPFSSFLRFFTRAAAQLQWAEAIQTTMPQTVPSTAAVSSGKAASSARAESVLFELHSSLLTSSRQRPLAAAFVDRVLQCIPSSQGGAVTDELHYMLPPSLTAAVTSSSSPSSAATAPAAARQPIDPWCVLEGCGGGPLVDAVWDSSQALPRV